MGAWEIGNFDNDDAMDWLGGLADSDDDSPVSLILEAVSEADGDEYLEAPDCACALAAAEVVAAALGAPSPKLPPEAAEWVAANKLLDPYGMGKAALACVERVAASSELKELMEEAGDGETWNAIQRDLADRLRAKTGG